MIVAVTGATGFLGRYIVRALAEAGHRCRCWHRPTSDRSGFDDCADHIDWVEGCLESPAGFASFCEGTDAVVHGALLRPASAGFREAATDHFDEFIRANLLGSLSLSDTARRNVRYRADLAAESPVSEVSALAA